MIQVLTREDNLSSLSLGDTQRLGRQYNVGDHDSHCQTQETSPTSSARSSPQPQIINTRARASSLNTRGGHGRSTAHVTQQQVNKKRQRATPEQLLVLEEAFDMNASPNAKMREMISSQISMTERSVQIWFQNRQAIICHHEQI